jgi:hypothetical protein
MPRAIPAPNTGGYSVTKCGAAPGPGCIGCYARAECGTTDEYSESYAPEDDNEEDTEEVF